MSTPRSSLALEPVNSCVNVALGIKPEPSRESVVSQPAVFSAQAVDGQAATLKYFAQDLGRHVGGWRSCLVFPSSSLDEN